MIKTIRLLLLLIPLLLGLVVACTPGGAQVESTIEPTELVELTIPVPTDAATEAATAEATVTTESTADPATPTAAAPTSGTLDEFVSALKQAISARDLETLAASMTDPFSVGYWLSEGVSYHPDEAADFLGATLLPAGARIVWADPDMDLAPMLQGQDPALILGPDKQVAAALLSYGWGEDGSGEAIQVITEQPDGSFQWELLLFSSWGFWGLPTDTEAVLINADEATFYSGPGDSYEPVATVFGGMTYPVIGISTDQQWYRLRCFDDANEPIPQCWVSADPAVASPTTAP